MNIYHNPVLNGIISRSNKLKQCPEERHFILRSFKKGDETGMLECIKDEYGNSYFKKKFYDADWIIKESEGEKYRFFVVETENRIAGVMILTFFPGESYIKPATQIIKKDYRRLVAYYGGLCLDRCL